MFKVPKFRPLFNVSLFRFHNDGITVRSGHYLRLSTSHTSQRGDLDEETICNAAADPREMTNLSISPNPSKLWSSNLNNFQRSLPWTKSYGCPTCSLRFSGWHDCWNHLKGQKHVRPGAYATKEQLRLLLRIPDRDAELSQSVVSLLRNPVASRRLQGEAPDTPPSKQRWMYQCPVCSFACSKWTAMWQHVGRTGHIAKESYRDANQLRLLLRKEKPPGSLALAFADGVRWEEKGGPVLADGVRARVVLRQGTLCLATPAVPPPVAAPAHPVALVYGPNPLRPLPAGEASATGGAEAAVEWTAGMHAALEEALREFPARVKWNDRLALVAERVGVPRAAVSARLQALNAVRGGGGVDMGALMLRLGYVAVDWECCGAASGASCRPDCLRGRGLWVWMDGGAPAALLARRARGGYAKLVPRVHKVRYGPRAGAETTRREPTERRICESRAGYRCPGCGAIFDRFSRLTHHLRASAAAAVAAAARGGTGGECVPAERRRDSGEVRVRSWLVAAEVKRTYVRTQQMETAGWAPGWDVDVRSHATADAGARRPPPADLEAGFQLAV